MMKKIVIYNCTYLDIVDGKTVDEYTKDAYDAKKSNIDKWLDSFANIGKVFNYLTQEK